jgi:hypothetical protein
MKLAEGEAILTQIISVGIFSALCCLTLDSLGYGSLTCTPLNFFYYNIYKNFAEQYYGSKPWHWNLTNGLPVMLGLYLPLLVYSTLYVRQHRELLRLQLLSVLYIVLLSAVTKHQEYRFLLPCLPFLHMPIGQLAADAFTGTYDEVDNEATGRGAGNKDAHGEKRRVTLFEYLKEIMIYFFARLNCTHVVSSLQSRSSASIDCDQKKKAYESKANTMSPKFRNSIMWKILFTATFFIHFAAALYLSTRHQVG